MLELIVPEIELFDEESQKFRKAPQFRVTLEHSLVSVSKWESRFKKAFLGGKERTNEETLAYVGMMILTPENSPGVVSRLTKVHFDQIIEYIHDPMTATVLSEQPGSGYGPKDVITSELIYYWMFSYNIPLEWENHHLNRLITLVRVFNLKNSTPNKKTGKPDLAARRALNEQRKAKWNTSG